MNNAYFFLPNSLQSGKRDRHTNNKSQYNIARAVGKCLQATVSPSAFTHQISQYELCLGKMAGQHT